LLEKIMQTKATVIFGDMLGTLGILSPLLLIFGALVKKGSKQVL
jgi:hypothetical protein